MAQELLEANRALAEAKRDLAQAKLDSAEAKLCQKRAEDKVSIVIIAESTLGQLTSFPFFLFVSFVFLCLWQLAKEIEIQLEEEDSSDSSSEDESTMEKEEAARPRGHEEEEDLVGNTDGSNDDDNGQSVVSRHGSKWRCIVCSLELNQVEGHIREMRKTPPFLNGMPDALGTVQRARKVAETLRKGNRKAAAQCLKCKVFAHSVLLDPTFCNKIHEYFPGKTCMEIVHSDTGKDIWKINDGKVTTNYGHTCVKECRECHRLSYQATTNT